MKKILLLSILALGFVACKKDLQKTSTISSKYELNNDQEVLANRFYETVEDLMVNNAAPTRTSLRWMHVARVANPGIGKEALAIADVKVKGNFAYVGYHSPDANLKSVIDVIDLSDEDIPLLVSSLTVNATNISLLEIDNGVLYAVGKHAINGNVLHKITLEEGLLTDKVKEKKLSESAVVKMDLIDAILVVQSKDATVSFNEALEVTENPEIKEVVPTATLYKSKTIAINADEKVAISDNYGADATGTIAIKSTKINVNEDYLLIADQNGELNIVQGIDPTEYLKCKGKKKKKKDDRSDKKKKGNKDKDDDDDKDDSSVDCQCEGKMTSFTFDYSGPSGVTLTVWNKNDEVIATIENVQAGSSYTVNGYDERGRFDSKTYIGENEANAYEVHTSCSVNIVGDTFGPYTITGYVDGEGSSCTTDGSTPGDGGDDNDDNDDNNGNVDCQCEGKMTSFTFDYSGPSGVTLTVWNKNDEVIATIENVQAGSSYTVNGYDERGRFDSKTYIGENEANAYEVHTSCSVNIVGDTFGPYTITGYVDGEGSSCTADGSTPGDGGSDDDNDDNNDNVDCQCEGKMTSFTFEYNGPSGVTLYAYNKNDQVIATINNVQAGSTYTVDGFDERGRFDSKTYIGESLGSAYEVHTSCSVNILGDTFGPYTITGFVDGEGSSCTADGSTPGDGGSDDDDDDDSDNDFGDCQCEGRMQSFTFFYDGPAGATVYAWNKKMDYLIQTFSNVQPGESYTVTGFDKHGRLESKTFLGTSPSNSYEIHTSCSVNILDEVFGPYTITGYVDGDGSACESDDPPVSSETFTECSVVGADPGYAFFQAVWLDDWFTDLTNGNVMDRGYKFVGGAGSFKELPDGKAVLSGEIFSPNYPNDRFMMTVYFTGKSNWTEWSALGRSYKAGAGYVDGSHVDWTYYIVDETKNNVMVGLGDNDGFVSEITARPADYTYGFQIGEGGANDKNSAYGMAGWFWYEHPDGTLHKADWNLDVLDCVEN